MSNRNNALVAAAAIAIAVCSLLFWAGAASTSIKDRHVLEDSGRQIPYTLSPQYDFLW
jgi:hypothetical protein